MNKVFKIANREIIFTQDDIDYIEIRKVFYTEALRLGQKYLKLYDSYGNIEKFSEIGLEDGASIIAEAMDYAVDILIKNDISMYDIEYFQEKFGERIISDWQNSFDEVNDQYLQIILNTEQLDNYRRSRRQNRSRWVGGGFGIRGALKGATKAGTLNLATGAVHGTINGIAKIGSSVVEAGKKGLLYSNKENKEILVAGIENSVFYIHEVLTELLGVKRKISVNDKKQANAIYNNLPKFNEVTREENIVKIFTLDPYNYGVYKYILKTYGDKNKELSKLTTWLDFDVIPDIVESLSEEIWKGYKNSSTKEELLILKEKILNFYSELGIDLELNKLKQQLDQLNLSIFKKQVKDLDLTTEEACINSKQQLKIYRDELKISLDENLYTKTLKEIEDKIVIFDKEYRTLKEFDFIFDTKEEINKVKNEYSEEIKKMEEINLVLKKTSSLKEINDIYQTVINFLIEEKIKNKKLEEIKKLKGKIEKDFKKVGSSNKILSRVKSGILYFISFCLLFLVPIGTIVGIIIFIYNFKKSKKNNRIRAELGI